MNPIEENAETILSILKKLEGENGENYTNGELLKQESKLSPKDINDAVQYLDDMGFIDRLNALGTAPFMFAMVKLNSRGRYAYHELTKKESTPSETEITLRLPQFRTAIPAGSPYGFVEQDWEYVTIHKADRNKLYVVFGMPTMSTNFDRAQLIENIKKEFEKAVESYNKKPGHDAAELDFKVLSAGYGEHLFNEIARDIIGSDIAVFELSDANPNVMIEMGVALTWGIRVLPLVKEGLNTPSDISGQTYVRYKNNGTEFLQENHTIAMVAMIERAMQRK